MPAIKLPYELLFRWKDGELTGSYIRHLERILDDQGALLLEREGPPESVAVAGQSGYPLQDVLNHVQAGAIAAAEAMAERLQRAVAEAAASRQHVAAAEAAREQAEQVRDAALTERDALAAERDALRAQVNEFVKAALAASSPE